MISGSGRCITVRTLHLYENLFIFSAHITNVIEVLSEVNKDSFVIMDELGSRTDPAEGMGIGEAGESCAVYIADRLAMPNEMLKVAIELVG